MSLSKNWGQKKNIELGIIVCVMYLNVFCCVAYLIQVVK